MRSVGIRVSLLDDQLTVVEPSGASWFGVVDPALARDPVGLLHAAAGVLVTQAYERDLRCVLDQAAFKGLSGKIAAVMLSCYPEVAPRQRLINACYGDDADGGPEHMSTTMSVTVGRMNKQLKPHGWVIRGQAGRLGGGRFFERCNP